MKKQSTPLSCHSRYDLHSLFSHIACKLDGPLHLACHFCVQIKHGEKNYFDSVLKGWCMCEKREKDAERKTINNFKVSAYIEKRNNLKAIVLLNEGSRIVEGKDLNR